MRCKPRAKHVARLLTHTSLSSREGGDPVSESSMIETRSRGVLDPPPEPVIGRAFARPVAEDDSGECRANSASIPGSRSESYGAQLRT